MAKQTRQPSGVVAGTIDESRKTAPDLAQPTPAGAVLARRKMAKKRALKAEARTRVAKASKKATVKTVKVVRVKVPSKPRATAVVVKATVRTAKATRAKR